MTEIKSTVPNRDDRGGGMIWPLKTRELFMQADPLSPNPATSRLPFDTVVLNPAGML